jgi:hypothetical protein
MATGLCYFTLTHRQLNSVFFLSFNTPERRSGTFFRRIFKVLARCRMRIGQNFEIHLNICLKYNKLMLKIMLRTEYMIFFNKTLTGSEFEHPFFYKKKSTD